MREPGVGVGGEAGDGVRQLAARDVGERHRLEDGAEARPHGNPDLATVLLPDVLNYDFSKATNYAALNGRRLLDDVIDISLNLVTGGTVTTDNVGPHTDYLSEFPYLGTPH